MSTIKEAKDKLNEFLQKLNEFDDSTEFVTMLDDNCGDSYYASLDDFVIEVGSDKKVYFCNY